MFQGAGGTSGGVGSFFLGLAMMIGGGYLFLDSIHVTAGLGLGRGLYRVGGVTLTSGVILIPFMAGVALIFYNAKTYLGWLLAAGSLLALTLGVLRSVRFALTGLSAFDLLTILVLFFGGLGLFLNSLRSTKRQLPK